VFLAVFQVIQCLFPIYHVFQFSYHIPSPTVCISHSTFFTIFFCHIPHSAVSTSHFPYFSVYFQCFSSCARSYTLCVSFSMFFNFLPIIQIL
jgi:hypothetical protein